MKKLAFTMGTFDCIDQGDIHLIKEMRKIVLPDNEVIVVLTDDYASFVMTKKFPIQDHDRRAKNLNFFTQYVRGCYSEDPTPVFQTVINRARLLNAQPIFVTYEDNKSFPGREFLTANGVSIRFIKKPLHV